MYSDIKKPEQRLAKDSVKVWLISETISNLITITIIAVFYYLNKQFVSDPSFEKWISYILIAVLALGIVFSIWGYIKPFLLYKNWRFDVSEEFLQVKSGAFKEEHHLIPMTKIQSVATRQGPLLRKYGLCAVEIDTMASTHTIPALPKEVGENLRNEIAHYAKVKEVES